MKIIKFTHKIYQELREYLLQSELEQMCYLFCYTSSHNTDIVFFPHKIIIFENSDYYHISHYQTKIDKKFAVSLYIKFIESDYTGLIHCHSHPFETGKVWFSSIDDISMRKESNLFDTVISQYHNRKMYYLSLVFGQNSMLARDFNGKKFTEVEKIIILNEPVQVIKKKDNIIPIMYDRQVRAFGEEGQHILANLKIAVIGIGGIGSIIIEGLLRLGVKHLILIDADKLDETNLNRWQAGKISDIGKYKVNISKKIWSKIFKDTVIDVFNSDIYNSNVFNVIKSSDCLIGCVDNAPARYLLNRISIQYLIPYIDGGCRLFLDSAKNIESIKTRLGIVIPSLTACFDCTGIFYRIEEVRNFFLDVNSRINLKASGYIKDDVDIKAPAVYPLNMQIASFILLEFLNIFIGYKNINWCMNIDYLDLKNSNIHNTKSDYLEPVEDCFCNLYLGKGDNESLSNFLNLNYRLELPGINFN